MSRCEECGQKECCGAVMESEIQRLREKLERARKGFKLIEAGSSNYTDVRIARKCLRELENGGGDE